MQEDQYNFNTENINLLAQHDEHIQHSSSGTNFTQTDEHPGQPCPTCGAVLDGERGVGHDEISYLNGTLPNSNDPSPDVHPWGNAEEEVESVDGEPGREDAEFEHPVQEGHRIYIPGYSMVALRAIFLGLARHSPCTCHPTPLLAALRDGRIDPASPPDTPSSTIVNIGSTQHTSNVSGDLSRNRSYDNVNSGAFGTQFDMQLNMHPRLIYRFMGNPLPLIEGMVDGDDFNGYGYDDELDLN